MNPIHCKDTFCKDYDALHTYLGIIVEIRFEDVLHVGRVGCEDVACIHQHAAEGESILLKVGHQPVTQVIVVPEHLHRGPQ